MRNDRQVVRFVNEELGLEGKVLTSDRPSTPFKAILRDTDADETFAIYFCVDLTQAVEKCAEFVG